MPEKSKSAKKPTPQELRDIDLEIQFLEGLLRRDERYVDALQILGDDYTRRGRYADGLDVDRRLRQLRPDDPMVHYNLACSQSLTGSLDEAVASLQAALDLGYAEFEHLESDADLESLHAHPGFKKLLTRIRRLKKKKG